MQERQKKWPNFAGNTPQCTKPEYQCLIGPPETAPHFAWPVHRFRLHLLSPITSLSLSLSLSPSIKMSISSHNLQVISLLSLFTYNLFDKKMPNIQTPRAWTSSSDGENKRKEYDFHSVRVQKLRLQINCTFFHISVHFSNMRQLLNSSTYQQKPNNCTRRIIVHFGVYVAEINIVYFLCQNGIFGTYFGVRNQYSTLFFRARSLIIVYQECVIKGNQSVPLFGTFGMTALQQGWSWFGLEHDITHSHTSTKKRRW